MKITKITKSKNKKKKEMTQYDVLRSVRKDMPPPGRVIDEDPKKYDRKDKSWKKDEE